MSTPIPPIHSLNSPEDILAAYSEGTLVDDLAVFPHQERDSLARSLGELHNAGSLNVLDLFRTINRDTLPSGFSFFHIQQIFCSTLPWIECSVKAAVDACNSIVEKGAPDHAASFAYDGFLKWLEVNYERVEDGLSLVRSDQNIHLSATQSVLIAGAADDPNRFAEEALDLSQDTRPDVRLGALRALGRMVLESNDCIVDRVMDRLYEVIASPASDQDAAAAIETALILVERNGAGLSGAAESLIRKASENPTQSSRHAIAVGFQTRRECLTEGMIDAMLEALQGTDVHDSSTVHRIDLGLSQWDLERDRERVLAFLKELLGHGQGAIDVGRLDSFRYELAERPGNLPHGTLFPCS